MLQWLKGLFRNRKKDAMTFDEFVRRINLLFARTGNDYTQQLTAYEKTRNLFDGIAGFNWRVYKDDEGEYYVSIWVTLKGKKPLMAEFQLSFAQLAELHLTRPAEMLVNLVVERLALDIAEAYAKPDIEAGFVVDAKTLELVKVIAPEQIAACIHDWETVGA